MLYIKKNQTGFGLIGVLIVVVIICILVYGGFSLKQNNKSNIENSVDILETAKKDINEINNKIKINNK